MKAVFFHDTVLMQDRDMRFYTTNGLNNQLLKNYLLVFNKMTLVTRFKKIKKEQSASKMTTCNLNNIEFKPLDSLNFLSLLAGKHRLKIRKEVRGADFIIIRMPSIIGIIAFLEAKKHNKPYLIELVGCVWGTLWHYGKIKYKVLAPLLYVINRYVTYEAEYVMYVANFLKKRYPNKNKNIVCSDANIPKIDTKNLTNRMKKIKKTSNFYKIGTIGNVGVRYKGQELVIKAISELNRRGLKIHYYLVGEGSRDNLYSLAQKLGVEDNIHFVGVLSSNSVFKFLKEIDIYIQPSYTEGMPRVVLEAFSAACPVIGSEAGAMPDIISSKYLFKVGKVKPIIKLIDLIIKEDNLGKEAKMNFRKAEPFRNEIINKKRMDFYKSCLEDAV